MSCETFLKAREFQVISQHRLYFKHIILGNITTFQEKPQICAPENPFCQMLNGCHICPFSLILLSSKPAIFKRRENI